MTKSEIPPAAGRSVTAAHRLHWLRCGTALVSVVAASAAHAQCASPATSGASVFGTNPTLPISSVGSSVQSLVGVLTTQNTASLTQTSGFIGAPTNPAENLNGGGVWVRGLGGTFDTRIPGSYSASPSVFGASASGACNVRTFQDFSGFQTGADVARLNVDGFNIHGGVTAGYTESTVRSSGFRADFQTPFVGVYGAITKGNFFADGQVRWDFFQGLLNDPSNTLYNQRLDARSLSLTGNIGYQFPLSDGWFVEPSAGAVYSEVKVDTLQTGGTFFIAGNPGLAFPTSVKIRDFDSILARASVRLGKNIALDGILLQPFVTASVINEFGGPIQTDITTGLGAVGSAIFGSGPIASGLGLLDSSARLRTGRIGTYGQFSGGVAAQVPNTGWLGYVRGDYRTGDRVDGWGISGGLRYQFNPETAARPLITKGDAPALVPVLDGPVTWTGFSLGGSAGGLWSQTQQNVSTFFIDVIERTNPHVAGVYAGGQVGADYQFGSIVVGVAGDAGFTNAVGGRSCSPSTGFGYNCQSRIDDLYMATGRIGYAFDRTLVYAKGGAVFADTAERQQNNFASQRLILGIPPLPNSNVTAFETGWTVGAGFEYAITKNWSAKAEYMHYELDRKRYANFGTLANQAFVTTQNVGDIVKIGVNYRFVFEPAPVVAAVAQPLVRKY
jgi:opacity protein-like surface antigen